MALAAVSTAERIGELKDPPIGHLPGGGGLPFFGLTFKFLSDLRALCFEMERKHGRVYQGNTLFNRQVSLLGAEANEFLLMDRNKVLSSELGWAPFLGDLFPRGLMLLDFDMHRAHRRILNVAFKSEPMTGYVDQLNPLTERTVADWAGRGRFEFYWAIKDLSLRAATDVFLGLDPDGDEVGAVSRALTDMVGASIAVNRLPVPGTAYGKGISGRRFMQQFLRGKIKERRGGNGHDMLTLLCNATDEDGNSFDDDQIVDHMNFMWMAAHDTITASVTTLIYELARNPDWQDRLAEEVSAIGGEGLAHGDLARVVEGEYAFKEALRLNPPVPAIPRRAVADTDFAGYAIPKGTKLGIFPIHTHYLEEHWPDPYRFDPLRFTEAGGVKDRHKYAWIPFSGGAHMCLGLHFAYMQAKIVLFHLLKDYRISVPDGYSTQWQIVPIPKPKDGLRIELVKA